LIVRKVGVIALLGISVLLSACFPTSIRRNEPPAIWAQHRDASREGETAILVLAISEVYRSGHWATIFRSQGASRSVQSPIFVPESELKDLHAKLSRYSVDTLFIGSLGYWTEKSDERIVEVCVIWPDGRFLALGEPTMAKWQRETRGSMTMPWREQLLESLSTVEVLKTFSPPGACPYAQAKLNWDFDARGRVITFLKQAAVLQ